MNKRLRCWKCGGSLDTVPLPLARLAECPTCSADLHVCRMCRFYDPGVADACREPIADPVQDKARANFCGYLEPGESRAVASSEAAGAARRELDSMFGLDGGAEAEPDAARALDDLFGLGDDGSKKD